MIDNDDLAIFFQPVVTSACIPVVDLFALMFASGVGHAAKRIVNEQHMGAAAHQSATNTCCEVAAALACCPTAARLAVFGELCLEDFLVLAAVHEVANIAPKIELPSSRCNLLKVH